jgi:isoleucyl-tRNA synthetase
LSNLNIGQATQRQTKTADVEPINPIYPTSKQLDFQAIEADVAHFWDSEAIFARSIGQRQNAPTFTFYEGPPSANGVPGIHHVMARAIKDIFCRYKTLKGFQVKRKAGWDTHGLPVELQVEKTLGITKKDIGVSISIADYNAACRQEVMKFKDQWDELTKRMGYWLDLDHPYITFDNRYIESVWHLLKRLYDKNLVYKGYTIQPYSPAAGTGLSTHELNLPGCYKSVKDTSAVAMFKVRDTINDYFLAWTTTPWTLPANTALAVGKEINYVKVRTYNPYTFALIDVILAKDLMHYYFPEENRNLEFSAYQPGDKKIPYKVMNQMYGSQLAGMYYEQLLPYVQPEGDAFRVIIGDFVSTEDGTGIVHIAPTFGSDDLRVAQQNNVPALTVSDEEGNPVPIVDKQGKFVKQITDFAGRFVKNYTDDPDYVSVDVDICIKLKKENKAFKVEKYEHNYPHCWRTDKPILYYPLDSWFIKTSAARERMSELNRSINWKPASTGSGRFGNWLDNLVDWNLSRSRYWGIPLPIWRNEAGTETICVGSVAELKAAVDKAVAAGVMPNNPILEDIDAFDLHRPHVDDIILADSQGQPMHRELDLIDVWFDSGAMPYAQWHYPFENEDSFKAHFPADFIAEGIDQTRGWFFTLHAIAVLLEDSIAYKNVIANGLVLDKNGDKMSKRLGNAVDPFETLATYGADPTRWYLIENAPPWENLRFNLEHIGEAQRKFFGTLYNTYSFFALYANIDRYIHRADDWIPYAERPELDRWIISMLHSLIAEADSQYADYDPTRAARAIQDFTIDQLSNWYVRLARRRFWKGDMTPDKRSAYQTLYECLLTVAQLMSPISPFFSDWLYRGLTAAQRATDTQLPASVHLTDWPISQEAAIQTELEARMGFAQDVCFLVRSIRKKVNIKVRQPLQKLLIPALSPETADHIDKVQDLIKSEVNVKTIELIDANNSVLVKKLKANFKTLGPRLGADMKAVSTAIMAADQQAIRQLEQQGTMTFVVDDKPVEIGLNDVEIITEDIPGWSIANEGNLTIALDIHITEALRHEGIARDLINRIQQLRKELDFDVTDSIDIAIERREEWQAAIDAFGSLISHETLARSLAVKDQIANGHAIDIDGVLSQINIIR